MNPGWRKLGLIYSPPETGRHPKLLTHAANPLAMQLEEDVYRIFYSGRDAQNRSSVGAVDVDVVRRSIIQDHHEPFFEFGPDHSFYADGVSIGNCYQVDGINYMLFMGWQNREGEHWRGDIGRLQLSAELELGRPEPLLSSNEDDPISLSYPWVMKNDEGAWSMWYGSTIKWDAGNGEMLHVIRHATSENGHDWNRHGDAVPFELGRAQAFSRPTVVRDEQGLFRMWFSFRSGTGEPYRIGQAISQDGRKWKLALESAGIETSTGGWDSEMIEYPFVFEHLDKRYMLYNGNGYGKSGFGMALWTHE